ncbi:MAG: PKD domain-containing protein, partial [Gammaproteobacteria bacterium]
MNQNNETEQLDEGFLNDFANTFVFKFIARFLIITQITFGIPVPAYASVVGMESAAPAVVSGVSVGNYELVSTKRITRILFEYTYKATVNNQGNTNLTEVTASLLSQAPATTVVDGSLTFGNVSAGASAVSQDTFTIRQDRAFAFNPSDLVWTVTAEPLNQKPIANAGNDQSVAVGTTVSLDGSASTDADGDNLTYSWGVISAPCPVQLSDDTVVQPSFTVNCPGEYVLQLVVNDGQVSSVADEVVISTVNTKPVANAGFDQTVAVDDVVMLDGSASSDVDGDILSFHWSIVSAPIDSGALISDASIARPELTFNKSGNYVIQLIVNDGLSDSDPDVVVISTSNSVPIAKAGNDRAVAVGNVVTLDGSASSDVDGDVLAFTWALVSAPVNSTATLSEIHAVKPTFDADLPGVYVAQLIVNDGTVDSVPDTVTITTENNKPTANAGPDQTVPLNSVVTLNALASSDLDQDVLTFHWSLTSKPQGSLAELNDPNVAQPQFEVDVPGSYVAQLIVNDGQVNSDADTVTITTENSKPVADAGPDQTVLQDILVQLDGSASKDADADPLTYQWSFTSQPQGSNVALSDTKTQKPTFTPHIPGLYVLQLIVNDGKLNSDADTVSITVEAEQVAVPNVVGLTQAAAESAIVNAKLVVGAIIQQSSDQIPAGQVISQNPLAGSLANKDSAVDLVVSSGPAKATVPAVVGSTQAVAEAAIVAAKLALGTVSPQSNDTVPAGTVISQSPVAGTLVNIGSAVDIVVSSGPQLL